MQEDVFSWMEELRTEIEDLVAMLLSRRKYGRSYMIIQNIFLQQLLVTRPQFYYLSDRGGLWAHLFAWICFQGISCCWWCVYETGSHVMVGSMRRTSTDGLLRVMVIGQSLRLGQEANTD